MKPSSPNVWVQTVAGFFLAVPLALSLAVAFGFRSYQVGGFDSQIAHWTVPAGILSALMFGVVATRVKGKPYELAFIFAMLVVLASLVVVLRVGVVVF